MHFYNGDGLRVKKLDRADSYQLTDRRYIWDPSAGSGQAVGAALPVILQETAAGQTTYYVYGLDLIASVQGSTATYYLTDGLGSTTQLADGAGAVTGGYTYDVFGGVRSHTGASTQWSFTGEQNDPNGLEYLRARYYDPATGRLTSQDLWLGNVFSPTTLNHYPYVLNDPLNLIDPYGYFPWDKVKSVGGCALNPVGCAKSKVDEALVDPLLGSVPGGGAAKCVYHHGVERCAADWAARQAARVLVGEKSYIDLNVTGGLWGLVGTGGLQFSYQGGLHPYAGGGVGTPGLSGSVTVGQNQSIVQGWSCGGQASLPTYGVLGPTAQGGYSGLGNSGGTFFVEQGVSVGTSFSVAGVCYYVR